MSCEKGLAVKSQIFIFSMVVPLQNVKQLKIRYRKKQLYLIRDIRIASDQTCQYNLQKILETSSKKARKETFFTYNVMYEKKRDITL